MTPVRIQRKRTRGWRMPEGAVYVGRPTLWGNPYTMRSDRWNRAGAALAVYAYRLMAAKRGTGWLLPLRNATALCCWCPLVDAVGQPVPCHADVLIDLLGQP